MKKLLSVLLVLSLLPAALAGGLLPSTGSLLGDYMPSAKFAIGKSPSFDNTVDNVRTQIYYNFDDDSYLTFSKYLAAWGCAAENVQRNEYVLTLDIVKGAARVSFKFDRAKQEATVTYPADTRPETEKTYEAGNGEVLPGLDSVYGVKMPNPSAVFGTKGSAGNLNYDETRFGWTTYTYNGISEADYERFGAYLADEGLIPGNTEILTDASNNKYLYSDLNKAEATLNVCYCVKLRQLVVRYSPSCYPETTVSTYVANTQSILPSTDLICVTMPSLSATLRKRANKNETLSDFSRRQSYRSVSEDDFNAFNVYLSKYNCELVDYSVNGKTINAVIAKDGESFSISYDSLNLECRLTYPLGTHVEEVELPAGVGDIITFGSYEQDNNTSNGKEPIEWIILDKRADGSLVLLSQYALDAKPYNTKYTDVTWETCTLRKWLNGDFYNTAFGAQEQAKIVPVTLENEDNPNYGTTGGNATQDRVWLLSINEATNRFTSEKVYGYFTDNVSRLCAPTKYAVAQGAWQSSDYTVDGVGACWWWLRSPGFDTRRAALVYYDGFVDYFSDRVDSDYYSVRPVVAVLP